MAKSTKVTVQELILMGATRKQIKMLNQNQIITIKNKVMEIINGNPEVVSIKTKVFKGEEDEYFAVGG